MKVRNLIAHPIIKKYMDENLFKFCMNKIQNVVNEIRITVPFAKELDEV